MIGFEPWTSDVGNDWKFIRMNEPIRRSLTLVKTSSDAHKVGLASY